MRGGARGCAGTTEGWREETDETAGGGRTEKKNRAETDTERASHESRTVTETHTFWHVLRGKTTRVLVVDVATSQKAPRSVAGADTTARHHGRDRRAPRRVHRVRLARRRDAPVLVVPRRHPRGRRPARRPPRRRRRARAMDDHDLGEKIVVVVVVAPRAHVSHRAREEERVRGAPREPRAAERGRLQRPTAPREGNGQREAARPRVDPAAAVRG